MLTQEEVEKLQELITLDYWLVILKALELPVQKLEQSLLSYDVGQGVDELLKRKCQLDGARHVVATFQQLPRKLKKKED